MNSISLEQFQNIRNQAQSRVFAENKESSGDAWRTLLESKRKELNFDGGIAKGNVENFRNTKQATRKSSVGEIVKDFGHIANSYLKAQNVSEQAQKATTVHKFLGNNIDLNA